MPEPVLPNPATGHTFACLIDQVITRDGEIFHAQFVVAGVITEQSQVDTKTYLSISTQCLLGSNNQMSIVFDSRSGTFALVSPLVNEGRPGEHLPIKTIVFGREHPSEDWRTFLETLDPALREAVAETAIGNPLEHLAARTGVRLTVDEQNFSFARFEGFVMRGDGHMTITATSSEVAMSKTDRCSISRLEHVPTDIPGRWSAMTFSHHRRGWRVRDQVHATGTITFI